MTNSDTETNKSAAVSSNACAPQVLVDWIT